MWVSAHIVFLGPPLTGGGLRNTGLAEHKRGWETEGGGQETEEGPLSETR